MASGRQSTFCVPHSVSSPQCSCSSPRKHEILTRSLRKMERTLDTVLRSLGNPSIASGMLSRSPSPSTQMQGSHPLLATPSPPESPVLNGVQHHTQPPGSPKLHSLPDNTLNPLGLLAEASLANRRAQAASRAESHSTTNNDQQPRFGVASDVYFKPGTCRLPFLARVFRLTTSDSHRTHDDPAPSQVIH